MSIAPTSIRPHATCTRTRLAESGLAAIDFCQCGHMHLHLGPLSLRITPEALRGVFTTLGRALDAHASGVADRRSLRTHDWS